MRVLLVDDERRYRDLLQAILTDAGHEVETADSGRAAIDLGVRLHPELLISDWMLCNHLHGLHVSEALQALYPAMSTILMTGYPSDDLRADAARLGIAEFLEKPFQVDELLAAVSSCARPTGSSRASEFGLISIDAEGAILHSNPRARELLAAVPGGAGAQHVKALFVDETEVLGDDAVRHWTRVICVSEPGSTDPPPTWWVRCSASLPRIVAMLPGDSPLPRAELAVQMLLAIQERGQIAWDVEDRVLVLERDSIVRDLYVSQLQRVGCICYKAETPALALDLLRADPMVRVVVIDREAVTGIPLATLIHSMQMIRSGLKIVGSSSNPREQKDFSALGIHRFIDKPWRTGDLIDVLRH